MIEKFKKGPRRTVTKLNTVIDTVNALDRIAGDQFIHITKQGDSYKIGLDIARLLSYLPQYRATGATVRKAYAKAAASTGTTTVCYLDTDGTGEEITVNVEISGGSNLNAASPLLADGDMIAVWNDGGTWRAVQTFDNTGEC